MNNLIAFTILALASSIHADEFPDSLKLVANPRIVTQPDSPIRISSFNLKGGFWSPGNTIEFVNSTDHHILTARFGFLVFNVFDELAVVYTATKTKTVYTEDFRRRYHRGQKRQAKDCSTKDSKAARPE